MPSPPMDIGSVLEELLHVLLMIPVVLFEAVVYPVAALLGNPFGLIILALIIYAVTNE
jgi:hypothetical protein